jgi:uncharacterized protein YxjI
MNALVPVPNHLVAQKAMFSFLGNTFRLFDGQGNLQYFIKQKAFKLKEELNVFADEAQKEARLTIKARSISDFSGGYDIVDATNGQAVGAGQRQGLKSIFKDEWNILDASGAVIGQVVETGGALAILRRFIAILQWIPQKYEIRADGAVVGSVHQRFNPFQLSYDVRVDDSATLDRRLVVGMVVLLLAIEGRG